MSDYAIAPSTGKLKLKGVSGGRVDKKKKSKKLSTLDEAAGAGGKHDGPSTRETYVEHSLDEDRPASGHKSVPENKSPVLGSKAEGEDIREHLKTEAERRHEDQRRKRLEERLKKEGVKSHKQRVEELNKYLSNLSEHHDMPKIGPG